MGKRDENYPPRDRKRTSAAKSETRRRKAERAAKYGGER